MKIDGIESCQDPLKTGVIRLAEEVDTISEYSFSNAHTFYLLNKFNPENGEKYLKKLWEQYSGDYDLSLDSVNIPFVAKLECENPNGDLQHGEITEVRDHILSLQQLNGRIANDPKGTPDLFWFLVQFDDIPREIERTKSYLLSNEFLSDAEVADISTIVLSLYDLNYVENEDKIRELGQTLIPSIKSLPADDRYDPYEMSRILMALPILPQETSNLEKHMVERLELFKEGQYDWWWNRDNDISSHHDLMEVDLLIGLLAVGYGPKISKEKAHRQHKIEQEHQSRNSPELAVTLPSTRFENRRTEIKSKIGQIIQSCENSLRISTLQMDMLHDDIFNRLAIDEEIDVRILTNTGTASGPRTKMKKAVMNELVDRLGGDVREDRLVHTRMVIGDSKHTVISTADLTRDQLQDSYNAGIYTKNPEVVQAATDFFESMWEDANPRGMKN